MVPLEFPMLIFPPHFHGKWRLYNIGEFEVNGVTKRECARIEFDLREF